MKKPIFALLIGLMFQGCGSGSGSNKTSPEASLIGTWTIESAECNGSPVASDNFSMVFSNAGSFRLDGRDSSCAYYIDGSFNHNGSSLTVSYDSVNDLESCGVNPAVLITDFQTNLSSNRLTLNYSTNFGSCSQSFVRQ